MRITSQSVIASLGSAVLGLLASTSLAHGAGLALPNALLDDSTGQQSVLVDLALGAGDRTRSGGVRISVPWGPTQVSAEASRQEQQFDEVAFRDRVDAEADAYGVGVSVPLPQWSPRINTALRAVMNQAEFEVTNPLAVGGREARADIRRQSLAVDLRFSPFDALTVSGTQIFGSAGVEWRRDEQEVRVDRTRDERLDDSRTETVPRLSLGVAHPLGRFHLIALIEEVDGASVYVGIRTGWQR